MVVSATRSVLGCAFWLRGVVRLRNGVGSVGGVGLRVWGALSGCLFDRGLIGRLGCVGCSSLLGRFLGRLHLVSIWWNRVGWRLWRWCLWLQRLSRRLGRGFSNHVRSRRFSGRLRSHYRGGRRRSLWGRSLGRLRRLIAAGGGKGGSHRGRRRL